MGHLKDVNIGYFEHMRGAFSLAGSCAYAAGILVVHGLLPDLGGTTGTDTLKAALAKLEESQKHKDQPEREHDEQQDQDKKEN